jgi:hypothetical protein
MLSDRLIVRQWMYIAAAENKVKQSQKTPMHHTVLRKSLSLPSTLKNHRTV